MLCWLYVHILSHCGYDYFTQLVHQIYNYGSECGWRIDDLHESDTMFAKMLRCVKSSLVWFHNSVTIWYFCRKTPVNLSSINEFDENREDIAWICMASSNKSSFQVNKEYSNTKRLKED